MRAAEGVHPPDERGQPRRWRHRDFVAHAPDELARNEDELMELLTSGTAMPHIGARYPLEKVADALRLVADGEAVGKVILDV